MEIKLRQRIIIVFIIIVIMLMGCIEPTSSEIKILSPTLISTQWVTFTQTSAPLETQDQITTQQEISNLMKTNNDCRGRCFWGIIPGVTSFSDAVKFLGTLRGYKLSVDRYGNKQYNHSLQYDSEKITIGITFSNIEGVVGDLDITGDGIGRLDVSSEEWYAFRPDQYLRTNGLPKQILIEMSEGAEGRISYGMYFIYMEGYIYYDGNQTITLPDHILNVCPLEKNSIESFHLLLNQSKKEQVINKGVVDLSQMTGMTTNDLYQILTSDPKSACFTLDYNVYKSQF